MPSIGAGVFGDVLVVLAGLVCAVVEELLLLDVSVGAFVLDLWW